MRRGNRRVPAQAACNNQAAAQQRCSRDSDDNGRRSARRSLALRHYSKPVAVFALVSHPAHCTIGGTHQLVRIDPIIRVQRNTDAGQLCGRFHQSFALPKLFKLVGEPGRFLRWIFVAGHRTGSLFQSRRRHTLTQCQGESTNPKLFLPACLIRYMALSAERINSSAVTPFSG